MQHTLSYKKPETKAVTPRQGGRLSIIDNNPEYYSTRKQHSAQGMVGSDTASQSTIDSCVLALPPRLGRLPMVKSVSSGVRPYNTSCFSRAQRAEQQKRKQGLTDHERRSFGVLKADR